MRAARRLGEPVLIEARAVGGDLDLVALDRAVQDVASDVGDPLLRTLDALHLASALLLDRERAHRVHHVCPPGGHRAYAAGLVVSAPGQAPMQ